MTQEVFSYKPFQKKGSHELMYACKANNFVKAQEILKVNRFLVYDFDYVLSICDAIRSNSQRYIGYASEVIMRRHRFC